MSLSDSVAVQRALVGVRRHGRQFSLASLAMVAVVAVVLTLLSFDRSVEDQLLSVRQQQLAASLAYTTTDAAARVPDEAPWRPWSVVDGHEQVFAASCPISQCPSRLPCRVNVTDARVAVVITTFYWNQDVRSMMEALSRELPANHDLFLVYDVTDLPMDAKPMRNDPWQTITFRVEDVLRLYPAMRDVERPERFNNPIWFNSELTVLLWARQVKHSYHFVWHLESDVRFTGHWGKFFGSLENVLNGGKFGPSDPAFGLLSHHSISPSDVKDFVSDPERAAQARFMQKSRPVGDEGKLPGGACPMGRGTSLRLCEKDSVYPRADLVSFAELMTVDEDWMWATAWTNMKTERRFGRRAMVAALGMSATFLRLIDQLYDEGRSAYCEMGLPSFAHLCGLDTVVIRPPDGSFYHYPLEVDPSEDAYRSYLATGEPAGVLLHPVKKNLKNR